MQVNIKRIILQNFKDYKDRTTITLNENLLTFIGSNSSGKSSVFKALLKVFSKDPIQRTITRSDFSNYHKGRIDQEVDQDLNIDILIEFKNLKETDLERFGWKRSHCDLFFFGKKNGYIEVSLEANLLYYQTRYYDVVSQILYKVNGKKLQKADDGSLIRAIVELFYIPATRDPLKELATNSETILYRILSHIKTKSETKKIEEIETKAIKLNKDLEKVDVVNEVFILLTENWDKLNQNIQPSKLELSFVGENYTEILDLITINFTNQENTKFNINDMSDGLQSLFYFTLVRTLIELELRNEETLLTPPHYKKFFLVLIEEPENHVAPNLFGRIIEDINLLSEKGNTQVLITSHSPSIIKRISPERLILFRNFRKRKIRPFIDKKDLKDTKFIKTLQAHPELYFSSTIILVEGQSEEIIIPEIFRLRKKTLDTLGVEVVPLGGAHVNHYWRLLEKIEIPFVTLLDLDRERNTGGWSKVKNVIYQLMNNGFINYQTIENKSKENVFHLLPSMTVNSVKDINKMKDWDINQKGILRNWIEYLEKNYNIFFSYPLDLDFLMLLNFKSAYINSSSDPGISLSQGITNTLKGKKTSTVTYGADEEELMRWYSILFLSSKGKPSQHQYALNKIGGDLIGPNLPKELNNLFNKVVEFSK
ncbi:ATP-dependent nuclease [Rossellomorea aquimaris]|uniref:ATP-dependent nuclease n=1 Tax=Rossellomorea aquimaris TaxID=189382 RepID=UPI0037C7316D